MNLEEMRDEVENLVDDPSFDPDTIDSYLNQMLTYSAGLVNLPTLKRISTVDTIVGQAYASISGLDGGFSGVLRRVKNDEGKEPRIFSNLESLLDVYPTMVEEGAVEAVALEGSTLWYQKIPLSAETLLLLYFQNPSTLVGGGDSPGDIPEHLHRKLLVHGAAYMMFDQIEDGIEGEKVNTVHHFHQALNEDNKHSGIVKLREWVSRTSRHHISSVWRY